MASAIHIFHHFFEAYKFKHGETFRVPYYLILANENLEHQLEYKDACPIPEVVFEQYKENNTTQTIEQEYKLMIPFITKKKEYDAQVIQNISKEAIIRIGDQELNDIKKLQTHIDEGEQISLKLTREVNLEFAPISMDLIWFFIAQTNCMKCISNSKNIYWFNTDIEKNDDNAKNLEILGLLISAYVTNKTQTSIHFPLVFYKKLLSKAISFHDLKEVYPNQHHDAKDLYQDCIESPDYNQFDIIDDNGNVVNLSNEQYDFLKPDDTEFLNINPDNRDEYIRRVVDYFYNFKIQWHFHHLLKGFNTNKIPDYVKYNFRLQEYDMLLSKSLQNKCPLGFRTCPKCGEIYYKDDGCNNVVCNICKTKFFFYNGGFNGIPGKQFENPPDYERFVLHKKVPQKRLDEFYEKYPYLKQNQEAYDEFYAQFPDLKQE
ncbi:ubiquitin-protein ligase E3A [Histomonas meleagridis]|uniref:ubiquitin-protein ligase E3A n=1 Tax=Histomonas meleagridis TaxID=135588 RepID=UPI003559B62B|nr:ubiquitin-protein ligase E3A [Histomonas meleagridis]